ncbi:MAG TPA: hypothetical protein VGL13_17295, partial [Polyangiaceae bacterium]
DESAPPRPEVGGLTAAAQGAAEIVVEESNEPAQGAAEIVVEDVAGDETSPDASDVSDGSGASEPPPGDHESAADYSPSAGSS